MCMIASSNGMCYYLELANESFKDNVADNDGDYKDILQNESKKENIATFQFIA